MSGPTAVHGVAALLVFIGVFVITRRSLRFGLMIVLLALVLSNGSVLSLKSTFLIARWGALIGLLAALAWPLLTHWRTSLRRLAVLLVLPVLATVSVLWSIDPRLTIERAGAFAILVAVAMALGLRGRTTSGIDEIVDGFAISAVGVLLVSALVVILTPRGIANGELRGIFENANGLGLYLGLTAPAVVAASERRGRAWLGVGLGTAFAAVTILSHSRSGMAALGIGMIVYEAAQHRFRRLALGCLLIAALIAVGLVLAKPLERGEPALPNQAVASALAPRSAGPPPGKTQSWYARLTGARTEAWRASLDILEARPIVGYGFGTGDRLFARYPYLARFVYFEGDNPNNAYLQLALELGLLGLLAALIVFACALWSGAGKAIREPVAPTGAAVLGLLVASLGAALVESIFTSAGAPWALLVWPSAAVLIAAPLPISTGGAVKEKRGWLQRAVLIGAAVCVVLTASGVALWLGRSSPPRAKSVVAEAERRVARTCGSGCGPVRRSHLAGAFWSLRVATDSGTRKCYVVDTKASVGSSLRREPCLARLGLIRPPALSIGIRDPAPPYFDPPASNPGGFEAALMSELAKRIGVHLLLWGTWLPSNPAPVDVVVHAQRLPRPRMDRKVIPYLALREGLLVRHGDPRAQVASVEQTRDLRLGAVESAATEYLGTLDPRKPPRSYRGFGTALAELRAGAIDGLVIEPSLGQQIADQSNGRLELVALFPPQVFYAIRVERSPTLANKLRRALGAMTADRSLLKLRRDILGLYPAVPVLRG
jgi:exopolysaccharide production protein ExoQ